MNERKQKIETKLHELGHTLGLENREIDRAKITMKSMLGIAIAAAIVVIIGKFVVTQLDTVGLYYTAVSIKDFGLFSRFF